MKRIVEFLEKYGIYILISLCLILGLSALLFKNATLDDDLYLWETSIMAEALKRGEWIGNYAVGTHGFLFKLPVAILFLLTGPSLAVATIWNVFLACISLYIFWIILKKLFSNGIYPFIGSLLLLCNFQFLLNLPTYMREFPVFLSLLLLIYLLVSKKSYWFVGLALLLILDAKEYLFFMILPAIVIYILIFNWNGFSKKYILLCFKNYIQMFLPTLVFVLLMIFTSVIPLNMYTLSLIPGVTKGGVEYQLEHFDVDMATTNRIEPDAPSLQEDIEEEDTIIQKAYKTFISYAGKILYPRSFSFLSIPKIIVFPALLTSIFLFRQNMKKKEWPSVLLSLMLWSFLTVFILRASFDRYLFPILPVIVYFFVLFLKELVKEKKKFFVAVLITSILAFCGLFFEVDYLAIKVVLNILAIIFFVLYYFLHDKIKNMILYISVLIAGMTFSVIAFFYYANGQLHQYLLWGHDYEVQKVVSYFNDDEKIMLNDVGWNILVNVYRGDNRYDPEWKWELEEWVPRKKNLKMFEKITSYNIYLKNVVKDVKYARENGISKIGLLVSTIEDQPLLHQERLNDYLNSSDLKLLQEVSLKNKKLYIFEVLK